MHPRPVQPFKQGLELGRGQSIRSRRSLRLVIQKFLLTSFFDSPFNNDYVH
jgi:hypothetical protein